MKNGRCSVLGAQCLGRARVKERQQISAECRVLGAACWGKTELMKPSQVTGKNKGLWHAL